MAQSTVPMTISQGLRKLKKLKGLLAEAQTRAGASSSWVAGKKPVFDFKSESDKRNALQGEIVRIEVGIARANATASVSVEGKSITLARAIRELQELDRKSTRLNSSHRL